MSNRSLLVLLAVILTPILFTGCELIGDIFAAGVWVGVIGVVLLVLLIIWIIRKIS